jgi:hypothetical protein
VTAEKTKDFGWPSVLTERRYSFERAAGVEMVLAAGFAPAPSALSTPCLCWLGYASLELIS